MRIVACVEARMGSSRLPGKVLKTILDKPMLQLMIERVKHSKQIDDIIVATTVNKKDDAIEKLCKKLNINVFRGSEEDVLSRVVNAVASINGDIIVEVTGDCPLVDPYLVDEIVAEYKKGGVDYISNCHPYSCPEGFDIQVFSYEDLKWISDNIKDKAVREHVSLYFYEKSGRYRVKNFKCDNPVNRPDWHLSVDEEKDFEIVKIIFENLHHSKPDFTVYDVVNFLDKNPDIKLLNENVKIKKRESKEEIRFGA